MSIPPYIRGSAETLYDFCTKQQGGHPFKGCCACPLHLACSQARGLQYSSLRDLMGMLLYNIQLLERQYEEERKQKAEQRQREIETEYRELGRQYAGIICEQIIVPLLLDDEIKKEGRE